MALRAGYYGVKRFLRDKLETIAGTYDETIKSLFPRSEQAVLGAKNLLDISKRSANTATFSSGGVTFNDDGTIVVNGVVSAEGSILGNMPVNIPNGRYKLSGCTGGSFNTYLIDIYETQWTNRSICYDGDTDFEFTQNVTHYIRIWLKAGTYNNLVFKPMIRLASDPDDTYVPYAMTNKELTNSAADQKTAINAIITAATGAADFAAFKTAMGAITPVTRSLLLTKEDITEEVKEDVEPKKTVTKKRTTKKTEEV